MFFLRLFPLLAAMAGIVHAEGTPPADKTGGSSVEPGRQSGPFLTPPLPPSQGMLVDSADMVPPVSHPDPALSPPSSPAPSVPVSSPATQNVTINLIHLMVKRGLISADDAGALVKEAEQEASGQGVAEARYLSHPGKYDAEGMLRTPPSAPAGGGGGDDAVAVTYVPDVVKNQIRDEVTADVMAQAREAGLATKNDIPDWVHRFHITGDLRMRYEDDMFPSGNDVGAGFINFNAINTSSSGLTVRPTLLPNSVPQYDVDQDRNRLRLRGRIGAEVDLGENFSAGMRLATGSDNSPVTENQTLGGVNAFTQGQGGSFSKYEIWLDRAYLRYELGKDPDRHVAVTLGRFDNPFFHSEMLYANDLGFDGGVIQARYRVADGVVPYVTVGGFPVFNTDFNFSTDQSQKFSSEDKYLLGAQAGTTWKINKDFSLQGAVAIYDFENIQGQVSDPIPVASSSAVGDTDDSRPLFAQNGNTYIAIRNFTDPNPADTQNQYFGLASKFQEVALTGQFDFSHFDPFHIALKGELVKNVAYDRSAIVNGGPANFSGPQNNTSNAADPNSFNGGDTGYFVSLVMGNVALEQFGNWNIFLTYRYVESDAAVDAFTDADFGAALVGTNLQGYTIGANFALAKRVSLRLAWMSADSIAGPTYHSDLLQFDINAKF